MDQRIIDLYNEFTHRPLPRRAFMQKLAQLVGSVAAAEAALALLASNYAKAAIVAETDPRVSASDMSVVNGTIKGYMAVSKGMDPAMATSVVIIIHQNRGLNSHIKDVARHAASEGFFAYAPDFLSHIGGTPDNEDAARDAFAKLKIADAVQMADDIVADFKQRNPKLKIGAVGFCWGGGVLNQMATSAPQLDAGIAYYGLAPELTKVADIKAHMMMHYGALDQRVTSTQPGYEVALKAAHIDYTMFIYEGANHAFNDDTSQQRYNPEVAKLAWSRTMAFLEQHLAV